MKESILTLIEGAEGTHKPSKQDICKALVDILEQMDLKIIGKFALQEAKDQFAKDRFFEKHGTTDALSWQSDAYQSGSGSLEAMSGHFRTLKTSMQR